MQVGIMRAAALVALLSLPDLATATDLAPLSDLDLIQKTRHAVAAQNAEGALDLLTEMERRGTGLFIGAKKTACEEQIELPVAITDWKFRAVARQAYFRVAMSRRLEDGSCSCLFDGFDFDSFVQHALGKPAFDLVNNDRIALETIRDHERRETEARFRELEQSCRAN